MISKENLSEVSDGKLIRIIGLMSNVTPNGKIKSHFVSVDGLNTNLIIVYDNGNGVENKFKYTFNYMSPSKNMVEMNGFTSFLSNKGTSDINRILESKPVSNPKTLLEIRNCLLEAAELGDVLEVKFLINALDTRIYKQEKKNKAFRIIADIARKARRKTKTDTKTAGKDSTDQD